MDLKIMNGVKTYRSVPANRQRAANQTPDTPSAVRDGYARTEDAVPEELRAAVQRACDAAMAYRQAVSMRKEMEKNAEAAKQQSEVLAKQAEALKKALEIYRRIASGGHVPPQDERFLQNFSPELYMAAKMAALSAKEHKKYDSVLGDEEEEGDTGAAAEETETAVSDTGAASVESDAAAES